jgi:hypothetical protein
VPGSRTGISSARLKLLLLLAPAVHLRPAAGLDDGLALTPPQAWTSWNLARFDVSADMILGMADALEKTGLKALGWDTLQIDEGWGSCDSYAGPHPGAFPKNFLTTCGTVTPRDVDGCIVANETKFPGGAPCTHLARICRFCACSSSCCFSDPHCAIPLLSTGISSIADKLHAKGFKVGV